MARERSLSGISPKTLSERLKPLKEAGVVTCKAYPKVPPRVEHNLTAVGRDLFPLLERMRKYGEKWQNGAD